MMGKFKITYNVYGVPQREIWESMEMAMSAAKRYSKMDEFSDVKIFDESDKQTKMEKVAKYSIGDFVKTSELKFRSGERAGQIQYPSIEGEIVDIEPFQNDFVYTLISSKDGVKEMHKVSEIQILDETTRPYADGGGIDDDDKDDDDDDKYDDDDDKDDDDDDDDDEKECSMCRGTGEGMYDGSSCRSCGGSGIDNTKQKQMYRDWLYDNYANGGMTKPKKRKRFEVGGYADDNFEIVVVSKETSELHHSYAGRLIKDRFFISAENEQEAKNKAVEMWEKDMDNSDLHIVNVMTDEEYRETYMADGGMMAHGGTIQEYVVWVSSDGQKREHYATVKSQRAAEMRSNKISKSGTYKSWGFLPKAKYDKSGLYYYEDGGMMADGGMVGKSFTIREMKDYLNDLFPDSFQFKLYPLKEGTSSTPDYDVLGKYLEGLNEQDLNGEKLYFPQYKRDHSINFDIHQGAENTYFQFLLGSKNALGQYQTSYVGTFGFKDDGNVSSDYITRFLAFLMEQYGLPFQVNHSVMAKGGKIVRTQFEDEEFEFADGGMAKADMLKEGDYVWNAVGKKLVVDDVTDTEYSLSGFMQIGTSTWSKTKVHSYLKNGEWSLKPKMSDGGYMAKGGELRKIKGNNFSDKIENGQKFKVLIQKVYDNQNGEKYPIEFIRATALTASPIVKNDGKNYLKGFDYKGTITRFDFLDDANFVKALQFVDRPAIKSMKF